MKVLTILGTRPEIIRLSRVIEKLDRACDHKLVHTGQNYETSLSDLFFEELGVRRPDQTFDVREPGFGAQVGAVLPRIETVLLEEQPDAVLVLGDTNSGLSAIVAARLQVPVFHMEAGNRCYDDRVPEEVNRRIIDHCSTILMPYTGRSRDNLLREGIAHRRIHVIGNPIFEVLEHYRPRIDASTVHERLEVEPGRFFLVTMHRAENVDIPERLERLTQALLLLARRHGYPVVCSLHPRTRERMRQYGVRADDPQVRFLTPLGFFDFVALERTAFCALSDSGTVQEECCIFGVPNVTIRDVTERPETLDSGSNMLSGAEPDKILQCVDVVTGFRAGWTPPHEYLERNVSEKVLKIVLGYTHLP